MLLEIQAASGGPRSGQEWLRSGMAALSVPRALKIVHGG